MDQRRMSKWSGLLLVLGVLALVCPAPAGADEVDDLKEELKDQKARSADLESRVTQLEAQRKLSGSSPNPNPTDLRAYWKEGLRLETQDKEFQLKLGGRIQYDSLWISEDDDVKTMIGEQEDGTEFRRVRLYAEGLVYGNMEYKLQVDFAGGGADLKDVYLGLTDLCIGKLRVGHFKEPFSLDELTSAKYITFLERGLPNAFAPSRNSGFMLHDTALDGRATWAIGVFRDTDDTGMNIDDGLDGLRNT